MKNLPEAQDKVFTISNPVGVDKAVEDLRQLLKKMPWISHPYHIAQRFYKKAETAAYFYPETYVGNGNDPNKTYMPLTPNNKYKGMFFFYVGASRQSADGLVQYPVAVIFSANLELIDCEKLKRYLFTQELIEDTRAALKAGRPLFDFQYSIVGETRDLRETYREFTLEQLEQYNRAPLQCFRFDLIISIRENC